MAGFTGVGTAPDHREVSSCGATVAVLYQSGSAFCSVSPAEGKPSAPPWPAQNPLPDWYGAAWFV